MARYTAAHIVLDHHNLAALSAPSSQEQALAAAHTRSAAAEDSLLVAALCLCPAVVHHSSHLRNPAEAACAVEARDTAEEAVDEVAVREGPVVPYSHHHNPLAPDTAVHRHMPAGCAHLSHSHPECRRRTQHNRLLLHFAAAGTYPAANIQPAPVHHNLLELVHGHKDPYLLLLLLLTAAAVPLLLVMHYWVLAPLDDRNKDVAVAVQDSHRIADRKPCWSEVVLIASQLK